MWNCRIHCGHNEVLFLTLLRWLLTGDSWHVFQELKEMFEHHRTQNDEWLQARREENDKERQFIANEKVSEPGFSLISVLQLLLSSSFLSSSSYLLSPLPVTFLISALLPVNKRVTSINEEDLLELWEDEEIFWNLPLTLSSFLPLSLSLSSLSLYLSVQLEGLYWSFLSICHKLPFGIVHKRLDTKYRTHVCLLIFFFQLHCVCLFDRYAGKRPTPSSKKIVLLSTRKTRS